MNGLVLHADADSFFASVVMRDRPELRTRPMAVTVHFYIASANYPARAHGVKGGMTVQEAQRRSPGLVVVEAPHPHIEEASDALFDLFDECARAVEPGSIEEAFLDVGAHTWEAATKAATLIRRRAALDLGLPVSIGIGRTKLMAKLASRRAKPDGLITIDDAEDAALRNTLPISDLWGIGPKTQEKLLGLGVQHLHDLDTVTSQRLRAVCGPAMAGRLRDIRNGTDDSTVRPLQTRNTLTAEASRSGYARPDHTLLELADICISRLCKKARRAGLVATGITITTLQTATSHPDSPPSSLDATRPDEVLRRTSIDPTADVDLWRALVHQLLSTITAGKEPNQLRIALTGVHPATEAHPTLF